MARLTPDVTAEMLDAVAKAYGKRIRRYGAVAHGVFWKDENSQRQRFESLVGVMAGDGANDALVVNDLGCGYGAMFDFLEDRPAMRRGAYIGYDVCADMIAAAGRRIDDPRASFVHSLIATRRADYSFASGTYNLHEDADEQAWSAYVKSSLLQLWSMSARGLAFNMLDRAKPNRVAGLFYADAAEYVDFCGRHLSANVSLVDNAPLPDWTILVRR